MKKTYLLAFALTISLSAFSKIEKGKPPVQLASTVLSSTTVKLTWMGTQKDIAYRLRIRPVGVLTWTSYNVQAPTCTRRINDLKPGTTYQWQVQTQFSKSPRDTSIYTNGPNFAPWEPCETAQGLITIMQPSNCAALMWVPVGEGVQYKVRLRIEGTQEWVTYLTDKNVLLINELQQGKGYEWNVTSQCAKSGLKSESSENSYFAFSPQDFIDNSTNPIGNYHGYDGTQLLTFYSAANEQVEATLQNHLGERLEKLPVYYTASNGTVAFNVNNSLPPGLYNVSYRCGSQVESRTLLIAGDY